MEVNGLHLNRLHFFLGVLQTIAFIQLVHLLKEKLKIETILVLLPVNTLYNWQSEFSKWAPKGNDTLRVSLVDDSQGETNMPWG